MSNLARLAALSVITAAGAAQASVVIVDSPLGAFNNPGPAGAGDALAADTWLRRNVRNDGSVGITADYPNTTTGSAFLKGTQGPGGASSKADYEYFFSSPVTLAAVSTLSYEWYRNSASAADAHYHPALRMYFDADGNFGTTNDQGYLVYERAYNPNTNPVPTDVWVADDVANFNGAGQSANLWMVNFGNPNGSVLEVYDRDLADWTGTANPNANYPSLNSGAMVYGLSFGIGSGWGTYEGAVDLVSFGVTGGPVTTWNFEVPTPGAAGLFSIAGLAAARRRRSN